MTLAEYIKSIEDDILTLEEYEARTGPLDCCDNRELEVLNILLVSLRSITSLD